MSASPYIYVRLGPSGEIRRLLARAPAYRVVVDSVTGAEESDSLTARTHRAARVEEVLELREVLRPGVELRAGKIGASDALCFEVAGRRYFALLDECEEKPS